MDRKVNLVQKIPESPGVYLMKDSSGKILYIGKAANLKRRVSSYFNRPHDSRIENLVRRIAKVGFKQTDSALEALILEAKLIKRHQPPFNIKEKDDRSFLYLEITDEDFPRVRLVRNKDKVRGKRFGPFVLGKEAKEAARILRRIFSWNVHPPEKIGKFGRPCLDYQINLCPGTCVGAVSKTEYRKTIRRLVSFLSGRKSQLIKALEKEMRELSERLEFEKAASLKKQIFALRHLRDAALISQEPVDGAGCSATGKARKTAKRIEGFDISNTAGQSAVGAMVVFKNGQPAKSEYRRFRIKTFSQPNDVGMIKEIVRRRFRRSKTKQPAWPAPDLILIDGGKPQVNAVKEVLEELSLKIPVVGIAKGPARKKNEVIGKIPAGIKKSVLVKVRDEAHRFAINYHKKLRSRKALFA